MQKIFRKIQICILTGEGLTALADEKRPSGHCLFLTGKRNGRYAKVTTGSDRERNIDQQQKGKRERNYTEKQQKRIAAQELRREGEITLAKARLVGFQSSSTQLITGICILASYCINSILDIKYPKIIMTSPSHK